MNIIDAVQGTQEWHAHRAKFFNASDASAALGLSRYKTRQQLMREKATGIVPEIDESTQRRFDKGHEFEAIARPWAEEIIGAELFPVVLAGEVDGLPLSASLDGLTMLEDVAFEHKTGNSKLLESLEAGVIPDEYKPQMEQCLLLSGATKCLFMASSGDRDAMRFAWYESDPAVRKNLLAGWQQFHTDLAEYVHVEQTVAPVAAPIEALPALAITVTGSISLSHNLERFGKRMNEYIAGLPTKPETDEDFINLDAAVKELKKAEDALDAEETRALSQTSELADMRALVAMYRETARTNRLMFEKLVKSEKDNRRAEIVRTAQMELASYITKLNERIGGKWMPTFNDMRFADAVKGLKSLDSMRDKVAGALANAKIEANEIADRIEFNAKQITVDGANYNYLVHDFAQVCTKPAEDFAAMMAVRVAAHKEAEAAKIAAAIEAERKAMEARAAAEAERIRKEEAAKLTANNQTQFEDQRGKADTGSGESRPQELRQQPGAAITPPTNHFPETGNMVDAAMITEFLALQSCSPAAKKEMRDDIIRWETYRLKMEAARGMAAAA